MLCAYFTLSVVPRRHQSPCVTARHDRLHCTCVECVERLEQDTAGVLKAWEQTRLLLAWERATQVEAVGKASELFPDATPGVGTAEIIIEAAPPTEADEDAGIAGLPFMQTDHEDEHEEWIDWAAVEQQAGGGGGSSS